MKWIQIVGLLCLLCSGAEKTFSQVVEPEELVAAKKKPLRLFNHSNSGGPSFSAEMNYLEHYTMAADGLQEILGQPNKPNQVQIDFKGKSYELVFERKYLTVSTYYVQSAVPTVEQPLAAYYYQGRFTNEVGWATMSIIDGEVRILMAHSAGNIEITKNGDHYVGYESNDRKNPQTYNCGVVDSPIASTTKSGHQTSRSGSDCLELYIECDHQSYLDNGSSIAATEAWVLSMINDLSAIYDDVDIPLVVESIFVHNTPDPYVGLSNKMAVRDAFVDEVANTQTARVGYLVSTRDLAGGISYGIGGFCGVYPAFPGPFAVATSLSTTFAPFPSYSFNIHVLAHELGHVLGARHTHACVWNGNESQIDDCGNVWAEQEGFTPEGTECFDNQTPIIPTTGTIMSLCDLVGGVGVNLANGFHSQVEDLLFNNYDNALCSTGGQCASIPPSNDDCNTAIELTSKQYCVPETYDNIMATPSPGIPASCGTVGVNGDVWFTYIAEGSTQRITIDLGSGLQDATAVLYRGSCTNLVEVDCQVNDGSTVALVATGVAVGQQIYIRLVETNNNEGEFSICVQDFASLCHPFQSVLIDLYNSAGGNSWFNNDGWSNSISANNCNICDWYGITCDKDDNIVELDLSFNNLVGTVPSSLELVNTLRKVDLFSNTLSGTMPDVWENMSQLSYLDLSANNFTGLIPRSLLNLSLIETLYLENNNLQDTLPKELGLLPSIDVLWLKNNALTGCFPATFSNICDISSKTFTGNVDLPEGGDFNAFCDFGIGNDADFDGYCSGSAISEDCDDQDATIYPGAADICDGKDNDCDGEVDEGNVNTVVWIGGNGLWSTAANWSAGQVPRLCDDVEIGNFSQVVVNSGFQGYARSITILDEAELSNLGNLEVKGSDDQGISISISANMENSGALLVDNITAVGVDVNGNFENNGSIFVRVIGDDAHMQVGSVGQCSNNGGQIMMVGE